jgi:hypothetical protein
MGLGSMIVQGILLAWLYSRGQDAQSAHPMRSAIVFNLVVGLFFISGTVLALAAKAEIAHLGAWFGYNLAFSFLQFLISGILFGFVFRGKRT